MVRLPVLLEELREGNATVSSGSSGVDSGGGNWMLVRSGREPPVLCPAGSTDGFNSWFGDGKILKKKKAVIKLFSLPSLKVCSSLCIFSCKLCGVNPYSVEQHETTFTCASSSHFQAAQFFLKHQKLAVLPQSRGDEISVRRRKRSCEGCSENRRDLTGAQAPGMCSLTGCKRKMSAVINVLLITATTTYLIPGTSHVLDAGESSYSENTIISSEAVYMNHKCKQGVIDKNNNDPFHLQAPF